MTHKHMLSNTTGARERPIIFSAPMVRAILDGRKTQTRRIVKPQPVTSDSNPPIGATPGGLYVCPDYLPTSDIRGSVMVHCESIGTYHCMGQQAFAAKFCPYGAPGGRLWVRETWMPDPRDDGTWAYTAWAGCSTSRLSDIPARFQHPAFCNYRATWLHGDVRWTPSIHMPRWASRITLEIAEVRVERLHDISTEDARAEGCIGDDVDSPVGHFETLWAKINGRDSWEANPWVWALTFKRVDPRDQSNRVGP